MSPVREWPSWTQVGAQFPIWSVVLLRTRPLGASNAFDSSLSTAAAVTNKLAGVSQQQVAAGSNTLWEAAASIGK